MPRLIIILIPIIALCCNQKLELTTANLEGSWAYLDEDNSYNEIHFYDSVYIVELEDVGLFGFYYWIQNDTILKAGGENSRIPIALLRNLAKNTMTLERTDHNYELERIADLRDITMKRFTTDSLRSIDSPEYQERAKKFYASKGMEKVELFRLDDDFEDE